MNRGDDESKEVSEAHIKAHSPEAIAKRFEVTPRPSYLKDLVYGGIDGGVTTFAVVAGVAGAELSIGALLILGCANLIADGMSMAVGNYLGSRADVQRRARIYAKEVEHIHLFPEGEREEVRQIFARKGFTGHELESAVEVICADLDRWVDTMLLEEHGLDPTPPDPVRSAWATFIAFGLAGSVPLIPFVIARIDASAMPRPFLASAIATGITFFAIGVLKGRVVEASRIRSGLETLALGGAAAALAFMVGRLLEGIVS